MSDYSPRSSLEHAGRQADAHRRVLREREATRRAEHVERMRQRWAVAFTVAAIPLLIIAGLVGLAITNDFIK